MAAAPPDPPKPVADTHDMINMPPTWAVKEQIAMLLYPGFTALDLIGPQYMFASLMGAVYLLRGYLATSHWVARDLLKYVGAIPVNQRVVEDRNRITGAGVTAGLDFDLRNL